MIIFLQSPTAPIEPTSSLPWGTIRSEVGHTLGYGRTGTAWDEAQAYEVQNAIDDGVRDVLTHEWSFLKPYTTLSTFQEAAFTIYHDQSAAATAATVTVTATTLSLIITGGANAGTTNFTLASYSVQNLVAAINALAKGFVAVVVSGWYTLASELTTLEATSIFGSTSIQTLNSEYEEDYELPAAFGGLLDNPTFSDATYTHELDLVGPGMIEHLRQHSESTGRPCKVATRPVMPDGTLPQRYELMLYPRPDAIYTIRYRYVVVPGLLSNETPWPPGGAAYAEVIKRACVAAAEQKYLGSAGGGIHTARYQDLLQRSLAADARNHSPRSLGYNRDTSDDRWYDDREWRNDDSMVIRYRGL